MMQRWGQWGCAGVLGGALLLWPGPTTADPPPTPTACDSGVTANTLGPSWLKDMPDLLCIWNAPYNTAAAGLHDHGCFDDYACNVLARPYNWASLGAATDGAVRYCNDCTATNPCASGGDGVLARRENGEWHCSAGGTVRHTLDWYFPGTPSAAVQPQRALVVLGVACVITGAEISVNTTGSTNTTWNLQRCLDADCTSPTNVFTSDSTLSSGAQRYYPAPNTTTISAGDAFRVKFVTVGTGLADVAVALTYACDQ